MTSGVSGDDRSHRLANTLVIVALVCMLLGAMCLLAAREAVDVRVGPGESMVVLRHDVPAASPFYDTMAITLGAQNATLLNDGNVTLYANETSRGIREARSSFIPGQVPDWTQPAAPGDAWTVTLVNGSNQTVSAVGTASSRLLYTAGGVLVGFGVLGFVFYRVGMRRA